MKIYLKNLDGIRFFAALFVLLQHSFGFKKGYSTTSSFADNWFEHSGVIGVNLFFLLSGFLISYLLLIEKDSTGTVSYKNFYIRRMLRIWPLYLGYGLVLAFVSPYLSQMMGLGNDVTVGKTILNIIFLFLFAVNFQLAFIGANKGVFDISWSVCVEEQFYLIWPIFINNFRKKLMWLLSVMVITGYAVKIFLCFILPNISNVKFEDAYVMNYLMITDKLDLFGAGLVIALLYYHRDKFQNLLKTIFHPAIQWIMLILSVLYVLSIIRPEGKTFALFGDHFASAILFGYLLLSAVMDNSILNLENNLLRTLGRVSYGIYLFHTAVCQVVLVLFKKFIGQPDSYLVYEVAYPLTNTIITCIVAYFSYEYFEKIFLKMKNRFALIKTRI